jgi:PASTA domain/TIR domain
VRSIFISYRRNDTEGEAGRLFDDLISEFGENSVFMDVAAIEAGRDFRKVIDESVSTCGVLLAIIGKGWIDAKDESGNRRLDDPMDFVRLETASALRRDIPVIPVLVRGSKMPRPEDLPDDLRDLAYRNCVELTHARWGSDLQLLMEALRRQLKLQKSGPLAAVTDAGASEDASGQLAGSGGPSADLANQLAGRNTDGGPTSRWPLITALAVCAIVAAIGGYKFFGRQATVPDLRGDTVQVAKSKLAASHLQVGQTTVRQDSTVDPNVVLSQFPPSDERVKAGTAVDLVVSAASAQAEVPALTGQSLDAALHTLAEHQLNVGDVQRQARAGVDRDTVLQQFPKAGEQVKINGKIDLLVSDAPPAPTAAPPTPTANKTADADWAAQRATQRAAAKQAALKVAAEKAAAEKAAAEKAAADKTAPANANADKAGADKTQVDKAAPKVVVRAASCTTLGPGKYRVDFSGDATVASLDTYLLYTWASVGTAGTRWRPDCKGWSTPTASDDSLWEVSCIHRSSDPPQMSWQTSRIIVSKNNQPPTTAGTTIFKPGLQSPSSLKFNVTCQ